MRISDISLNLENHAARISALVSFEDCDQPAKEVFIATEPQWADSFDPNPNAFLVGCILPAMHFGEKRLALDGEICPSLRENLDTVMGLMRFWSGGGLRPLTIEAPVLRAPRFADNPPRAGMFMSGGMDSLATLRKNRKNFPPEHPGYVKDCLILHGFDIGGVIQRGAKYHVFERARERLGAVARDAGVNLIPIYTNLRHLFDEREFWLNRFYSAVLAAAAHAFAPRFNLVYVASGLDFPKLAPCGSHPLLDKEYSSYELRLKHAHLEMTRLDKIRLVAGWEAGLQNFRVCLANKPDDYNCGRCEKCIRTMLGLLCAGALHKTRAFADDDVTPELLASVNIRDHHRALFYHELVPALREIGRLDLVEAIEKLTSPDWQY